MRPKHLWDVLVVKQSGETKYLVPYTFLLIPVLKLDKHNLSIYKMQLQNDDFV